MTPSDELFKLIKSLSKSEKRYFHLFATKHIAKEKNDYLKLFEAIEKQKTFDENGIKKILRGQSFVKHLSAKKNYLTKCILDSLHHFHLRQSTEAYIKKQLHIIAILFPRGQYRFIEKHLSAIKEKAYIHEEYLSLIDVIKWEKKILYRLYSGKEYKKKIQDLYDEERRLLKLQATINDFWKVAADTGSTANQGEKYNIFAPEKISLSGLKKIPFEASYQYLQARIGHAVAMKKPAYKYSKALISLFENNVLKIISEPDRYMHALNNHINSCSILGEKNEVISNLQKLKTFIAKYQIHASENLKANVFVRSNLLELQHYLNTREFYKINSMAESLRKGVLIYQDKMELLHAITLYYTAAHIHFINENFDESLKWLNRILYYINEEVRRDICSFSRIMILMIHMEISEYRSFYYNYTKMRNMLNKTDTYYEFEKMFIENIKQIAKSRTSQKLKLSYEKLKDQLIKPGIQKSVFDYFDFTAWVDSKLQKRPFAKILMEKA